MLKNSGTKIIKTERLVLRKFKMSDAEDFYNNVGSDKEVTNVDILRRLSQLEKIIYGKEDK